MFLSKEQREYLKDNYEPSSERKMRLDIRDRIKSTLDDFELVVNELDAKDIELLFREPEEVSMADELEHPEKKPESAFNEYQSRLKIYRQSVAMLAFFYEAHYRAGWDFGDTLRLALKQAHGRKNPRQGDSPNDLPPRQVNREEFEFDPALEPIEEYGKKLDRIEQKVREGEEPLTDEELLFYYEHTKWRNIDELVEFRKQQRELRRKEKSATRLLDNHPWVSFYEY